MPHADTAGCVIKQALYSWPEREAEYHRRTMEALADVDAGRLIDHELVQPWANSLETNHPDHTRTKTEQP
jgi:predicted transcriptional regulator